MRKLLVLALLGSLWGCGKKVQVEAPGIIERDRDLYVGAMELMEKSRYDAARINLDILMQEYPDSEFTPQAKYAVAESWYRQGGSTGMSAAEVEFKDYITFFPDTELADDAQLMVAMTHVKQMEGPDRDNTHAKLAEVELLEMIRAYPSSPLVEEAKQKLRDVQEILAESIFAPARQYYRREAFLAVIDRCEEVLDKYPDFTGTDRVLYQLAEAHRRIEEMEDASNYYAQIVRDFPRSERVEDAKKRLTELRAPIPDPNPLAIARAPQEPDGRGILGWLFGSGRTVSTDTQAASVKGGSVELSADPAKQ
jgi:outer membrane protein assembly factor BamD